MGKSIETLRPDAAQRVVLFATDFWEQMQGAIDTWSTEVGLEKVGAIKAKFPIPISATELRSMKGDPTYRTLTSLTVDVATEPMFDGVAELKKTLDRDEFIAWDDEPANMADAVRDHGNELIADLLRNGKTIPTKWDNDLKSFFATDHRVNPAVASKGTVSNLYTGVGAPSITLLKAIKGRFRSIKALNGKRSAGYYLTHILCHGEDEQDWRDLEQMQRFVEGTTEQENRHRGTFKVVVASELTEPGVFYPVSRSKRGAHPFVVLRDKEPEVRMLLADSALYEKEFKYGADIQVDMGAALGNPMTIHRYES